MRLEDSLSLSPAQEFSIIHENPHFGICQNLKIKFFGDAYKSLKASNQISEILDDVFRVAAGGLRIGEIMQKNHKYEYEPSLIVIYRSAFQAVTMCIHVYREDISINHTESSVWINYGYCISVLSVGKFLTANEIFNYYKQGIAKNSIVKIPGSGIARSIYGLVSFNKGVISLRDITDKSTTKQKRFILALYDTNSAICYLKLKEDYQYSGFKEFKMEIFKSNFISPKNLAIFRYDYTDTLSESVAIQITQKKKKMMHNFTIEKLKISNLNFIFNLQFQPNKGQGESGLINPPGKPIVSPILQLYYFYVYMMQTHRSTFKLEVLIEEYEIYFENMQSNADEEILVCKLIGEHLNSFPNPLENLAIRNCLIICSYLKLTHMLHFNSQSTVSILESLSRTDSVIVEFKTSKYFSKVLKGIAYLIIRLKKENKDINEGIKCLELVTLLLDRENIKELGMMIVQLVSECAGVIFTRKELDGLEEHCDKETIEDFSILYNALSLYSGDILQIIEYLEKLIEKKAKINEDLVLPYLTKVINDTDNCKLEAMAAVAITIHNKSELLMIFSKIGFSESMKRVLEQNMKSDYLKLYQDILFVYYNNKILDDKFRTEYLFNLMQREIVLFSDLIMAQQDQFTPSFDITSKDLMINCFEKCILLAKNSLPEAAFIVFTLRELESLSYSELFQKICPLVIHKIFPTIKNYNFVKVLPFLENSSNNEIKNTFKDQAQAVITNSKIPKNIILELSTCKSASLQNWALIQVVIRLPSLTHDELVQKIIVAPTQDPCVLIIIQYFTILKNTEVCISMYNFILEIWKSFTHKTILIGLLQLVQTQGKKSRKRFALLIYSTAIHTEKTELMAISEKIRKIVVEFESTKNNMDCLGLFYDYFYSTETVIREAADNFKSYFARTLIQIPLIEYTPPELSLQYVKISSKLKCFIPSKTFLRYVAERKSSKDYTSSAEFIKICEESFIEFESNMKILAFIDATTATIDNLLLIFKEFTGDLQEEVNFMKSKLKVPVPLSIVSLVPHLSARKELEEYCRLIIEIYEIYHNMDKGAKVICELYLECLNDLNKSTINEFIERSERASNMIKNSQMEVIAMTLYALSTSKELLIYLVGTNSGGYKTYTERVFQRLANNLDNSNFSTDLSKSIIEDFRYVWVITATLTLHCNTFDILVSFLQKNTNSCILLGKIQRCNKYLYDLQDYYISTVSKEEYEGEIIKLIYKRSTIKFHRIHFTEQYSGTLKYGKKNTNLGLAILIDLNKKLSSNMIIYSPEAQNTANRDEVCSKFLLLTEIAVAIVNSLN